MERVAGEIRIMLVAGLSLLALATVAGFFSGAHSLLDWFADFRALYVIAAFLPLAAFVRRDLRIAAAAVLVIAVNLVAMSRWLPTGSSEGCAPNVSAMTINAFGTGSDHDALLALLAEQEADVVFVSELTGTLRQRLAAAHAHHATRPDAGIGLFTRWPIEAVEWGYSPAQRPYLVATLNTPRGRLRVIGAHPPPPVSAAVSADRNYTLHKIGELAGRSDLPTIALGDLNVTMLNPQYAPVEATGLRNVRDGRGLLPTWPSPLPLRIPIDHILHSAALETCDAGVLPSFGSDHLPLRADLRGPIESGEKQTFVFSLAERDRLR